MRGREHIAKTASYRVVQRLVVVLTCLFLLLQYKLWAGEGSWMEVKRLREAVERQEQSNTVLRVRNRALDAEVKDLKKGLAAIEERARSELGMVKANETFFQIIE